MNYGSTRENCLVDIQKTVRTAMGAGCVHNMQNREVNRTKGMSKACASNRVLRRRVKISRRRATKVFGGRQSSPKNPKQKKGGEEKKKGETSRQRGDSSGSDFPCRHRKRKCSPFNLPNQ